MLPHTRAACAHLHDAQQDALVVVRAALAASQAPGDVQRWQRAHGGGQALLEGDCLGRLNGRRPEARAERGGLDGLGGCGAERPLWPRHQRLVLLVPLKVAGAARSSGGSRPLRRDGLEVELLDWRPGRRLLLQRRAAASGSLWNGGGGKGGFEGEGRGC